MERLVAREQNQLILGDCLQVMESGIPRRGSVDLIHTSPPYNIGKSYHHYHDNAEIDQYLSFINDLLLLCHKALKPGGSFFWQTGYTQNGEDEDFLPIDILTYNLFRNNGFYLKDRIIWHYLGGMSFKTKFMNRHETILWYVKKNEDGSTPQPYFNVDAVREKARENDPRNNLLGRNPGNVWIVDRVAYGSAEQTSHIAVFPEEICERIIRACSQQGDLIFDPFCGSGTVPKVAKSLGRSWLGIEISSTYHKEAERRLGFQQPGENRTVLSQIVKDHMVEGRSEIRISELAQVVRLVFGGDPYRRYKKFLDESNTLLYDKDQRERKDRKKEVWERFERFFQGELPNDLMVQVVSAYTRNYKLAKEFNEYRLFCIGLDLLKQYREFGKLNPTALTELINELVRDEPESFTVSGGRVRIKAYERRIRFTLEKKPVSEPSLF